MTFRAFVDETKAAAGALIAGRGEDRDLSPMVHLQTQDGRVVVAVDPAFFADRERKEQLVRDFIVPLVREHKATVAGWTLACVIHPAGEASYDAVVVVVIDAEREETWIAAHEGEVLAPWEALTANESEGIFVEPIQEEMR